MKVPNKRKPYSLEKRVQMVALKEQGLSNRKIAMKVRASRRGVDYVFKTWKARRSLLPKKQRGATIKFTDEILRAVTLEMKRGRILVVPDIMCRLYPPRVQREALALLCPPAFAQCRVSALHAVKEASHQCHSEEKPS